MWKLVSNRIHMYTGSMVKYCIFMNIKVQIISHQNCHDKSFVSKRSVIGQHKEEIIIITAWNIELILVYA